MSTPVTVQTTLTAAAPATIVCGEPVTAPVCVTPATCTEQPVTAVFPLPVFEALRVQTPGLARVHETTLALMRAELVNDPKRPNTNPAMAIAAMSVIAIRITVARTGEIAFLLLLVFMILKFPYSSIPRRLRMECLPHCSL